LIAHIVWFAGPGDDFEIMDAGTNGNLQGVGIHDTCKCHPGLLAAGGFHKQVIITRKKHPPECRRTIKQGWIAEPAGPILLRSQNIDTSSA